MAAPVPTVSPREEEQAGAASVVPLNKLAVSIPTFEETGETG